jgi:hypothetical protein
MERREILRFAQNDTKNRVFPQIVKPVAFLCVAALRLFATKTDRLPFVILRVKSPSYLLRQVQIPDRIIPR